MTARVLMIALPIAVGLFAWSRPASARFGRNLTLTGFVYFLAMLSSSADEVVYSAGRVAGWVVEVWITYLVLSFPTGRLTARHDRVIVALGVLLVAFLYLPTALLGDDTRRRRNGSRACRAARATRSSSPRPSPLLEAWLRPLRELLTIALFVAATVSLALRMPAPARSCGWRPGPVLASRRRGSSSSRSRSRCGRSIRRRTPALVGDLAGRPSSR